MKKMTIAEFNKAFTLALEGIGNDFVNELVRVAPVDTSFLRNSIRSEVKGNTINISMAEYAYFLEFGTYAYNGTSDGLELRPVLRKKDMTAAQRQGLPKGMEPYPFIRATINTKLRDIVYENLKRQLEA